MRLWHWVAIGTGAVGLLLTTVLIVSKKRKVQESSENLEVPEEGPPGRPRNEFLGALGRTKVEVTLGNFVLGNWKRHRVGLLRQDFLDAGQAN